MVDVPCGTCRACCRNQRILLEPDELGYLTVPTARGQHGTPVRMLQHQPDGACIYLTEQGCSIHERAPRACQSFDCRAWLRLFPESDWDQMEQDGLDGEVVGSARIRLSGKLIDG
jgi:hypothetical protein